MLLGYIFDEHKISKLSSEMLHALSQLDSLAQMEKTDFISDPITIAAAKYYLIVCIEAAIDLCNHIISKNKLRAPDDYADVFKVMGENHFFPSSFVDRLMQMARFRNRLVHIYWQIDVDIVYTILQDDLSDFERFLEYLREALNNKTSP
ncbi:MAG: DUF86 domain-containing protein [Candidatus Thermoplasmatota archaeon]|nr:DUF86 domain-containing protein [Candidatus Thermoplasmatota archaeon]